MSIQKRNYPEDNASVSDAHTAYECKDELISAMISVLNLLIAKAAASDMGTAARILYSAKEEMVHWAVDMDFHESAKDRFVNRHMHDHGSHDLSRFLALFATIKDEHMKKEILRLLGLSISHGRDHSAMPEENEPSA